MAVTLVVSDGESEVPIELAGPGGKDRIAVGRPGRPSSVWMVWANKNKYDLYVAARVVAWIQKFSLHESGDWRHQWTPQADLERLVADQEGGSDRVLGRWQRPEPNGVGVRQGLSIWVPHGYINDLWGDEQGEDGVIWIPDPGARAWPRRRDSRHGLHTRPRLGHRSRRPVRSGVLSEKW